MKVSDLRQRLEEAKNEDSVIDVRIVEKGDKKVLPPIEAKVIGTRVWDGTVTILVDLEVERSPKLDSKSEPPGLCNKSFLSEEDFRRFIVAEMDRLAVRVRDLEKTCKPEKTLCPSVSAILYPEERFRTHVLKRLDELENPTKTIKVSQGSPRGFITPKTVVSCAMCPAEIEILQCKSLTDAEGYAFSLGWRCIEVTPEGNKWLCPKCVAQGKLK